MADPDRRVYFLIQRAAHRLRLAADRECLATVGVTTAQIAALLVISEQPGCAQRHVASALGQRESATTTMIGRLVDAGFITKTAHPTEHRAFVLNATIAGRRALAAARPRMDDLNRRIQNALGAQFDDVAEGLQQLIALDP